MLFLVPPGQPQFCEVMSYLVPPSPRLPPLLLGLRHKYPRPRNSVSLSSCPRLQIEERPQESRITANHCDCSMLWVAGELVKRGQAMERQPEEWLQRVILFVSKLENPAAGPQAQGLAMQPSQYVDALSIRIAQWMRTQRTDTHLYKLKPSRQI